MEGFEKRIETQENYNNKDTKLQNIGKQALDSVYVEGIQSDKKPYLSSKDIFSGEYNDDFPNEPTEKDLEVMKRFHISYEKLCDLRGLRGYCWYTDSEPTKSSFKNRMIKKIWEADEGWFDSIQYAKAKSIKTMVDEDNSARRWVDLHNAHPYIYPVLEANSPEEKELEKMIQEDLDNIYDDIHDSLDPEKVSEIERLRTQGEFLRADQMQVDHIRDILGIERPVVVSYYYDDGPELGIFTPEVQFEDGSIADTIMIKRLSDAETGEYDPLDSEKEVDLGETITHELFHEWQFEQMSKGTPLGELIAINEANYMTPLGDLDSIYWGDQYERYRNQLNERQAMAAGAAYRDFAERIRESSLL